MLYGSWVKSATQLTIVQTFDGKRIRDYNSDDMAHLVELMAKWRYLLGATSDPTPEELTIVCQFVYDNFENLTYLDICTAMNWAIGGKIDMGFVMQKSLSTFYVAKAIRLYLNEKTEIVNEIARAKERAEMELQAQKVELTPEQKAANFKEHIIAVWKAYKSDGEAGLFDIGSMVYNWMRKSQVLIPTPQDVSVAMQKGNDRYIRERQEENLRNILNKTTDDKAEQRTIKKYAREYLISQVFDKYDINQLVAHIRAAHFIKENN